MQTIKLPCYGIVIEASDDFGEASLSHDLGQVSDDDQFDAIDGILSLILAHACAGIDVTTTAYVEGVETAIEAADNHL